MHDYVNFVVAVWDNLSQSSRFFEFASLNAAMETMIRYNSISGYEVSIYCKIPL